MRLGTACLLELDRCVDASLDISQAAATMLAVIDGAGEPLTPSQISERVLVASASTTATLDVLERRGWIRRTPNPGDRRSTLVEITDEGRRVADPLLAGIRSLERKALDRLSTDERTQLLDLLGRVMARVAELADVPSTPAGCTPRGPTGSSNRSAEAHAEREREPDLGAAAGSLVGADAATVGGDDAGDRGQADAVALDLRAGRG